MDDETETELYYAIEKNNVETLKRLLDNGLDPDVIFNGYDSLGKALFWCPLHFCCEKGRLDCARMLLEYGADPDVGDRWCMTPLMYAVRTEWHNMVELMIKIKASVDLQDTRGRTPLHLAMECSDDVCVQMLCDSRADVNVQDLVGRTPAWVAVTQDGRKAHLERLLKEECDVNIPDKRDKRIAIQEAIVYANNDCLDYVRMLLSSGSNVNHRDEANLNTMLNLLVKSKRKRRSINKEEFEIARLLIDAGYKLNDVPYRSSWHKYGGTALKMAAEQGATELIELFLEHDADPDLPDDCGVTPLLAAVSNDHIQAVVALLRINCQIDIEGEIKAGYSVQLMTPMQCAISRGNFPIARLLVNCGGKFQSAENAYLLQGSSAAAPEKLVENPIFWSWLIDKASNPSSLFDLVVLKIRRCLKTKLICSISKLHLPPALQRALLLDFLFANFNEIN